MSAERMRYDEATVFLTPAWERWRAAHLEKEAAREAYFNAAEDAKIRLCSECGKPMPDYDNSQNCDECHLPWGSATPEGRKKQRQKELDAKIAALQAEKARL